jgi:hypothetical protein
MGCGIGILCNEDRGWITHIVSIVKVEEEVLHLPISINWGSIALERKK